jgi:hypothetical protein
MRAIDPRALGRLTIVNRSYLYKKNFGGTLRGRLGFASLIAVLFAHRIVNREWRGLRGLLDGLREVRRAARDDRAAQGTPAPSPDEYG